ncbi:MAG: BatA domain-containing protein [Prevotella sp.]|nr:BatA domain-containing protein [Prevotella sp.]
MFRFESPIYLYLLVLIPILAFIRFYALHDRKKKLEAFGDLTLLKRLMPDVSRKRSEIKFWLLEGALTLLILMLQSHSAGRHPVRNPRPVRLRATRGSGGRRKAGGLHRTQ